MRRVCFPVFVMSGFAALLYQVIWQRMLVIFSGADVYSATIVIAAFMAGLGLGSLAGGHLADRVPARTSLLLFGAAEAAVAVFGLISAPLYYDVLYVRMGHLEITAGPMSAILFVSLLWPTFFMGASLPLLSRALTQRIENAASTIGALYGANTLGAALGALLTTWWLLPAIGLKTSLLVGASLNAACALIVLPFALRTAARAAEVPGSAPMPAVESGATVPAGRGDGRVTFWMWTLIYACSGLLALSLEIVWFRTLGVMMKSTAFTFGTLLTLYLTGLGLGAIAGSAFAGRVRRPAAAFLLIQAAIGLCAGGLMALLVSIVDGTQTIREYVGNYEPLNIRDHVAGLRALLTGAPPPPEQSPANFVTLYIALPAALVLPPTFLMGFSFPLLQRAVQTDLAVLGRRVGTLLVANIVGSMVGTVVTGWVLLDTLGTAGTFRLLAGMSAVFALVAGALALDAVTIRGRRIPGLAVATLAVALVFVPLVAAMPEGRTFWARLHGTVPARILFAEDGSGLSVIKTDVGGLGTTIVFANGVGQGTLPYGGIHTALGALPAFVHPGPTDVAVIGLGTGDTLHAVAGRRGLERITCVEIIRPQVDTLQKLAQVRRYGGLRSLLDNGRIEHIFADGRIHLMRGGRRYDIIEADALRPSSAYSGNLYSEEYFKLVRAHLKPNGLAATWAPTGRVIDTFIRVFPYVLHFPGILIGSETPIAFDRGAIAARLAEPGVQDYYAAAGIDINSLLAESLARPTPYTPAFNRDQLTNFNTDLFPKDEYDLTPRR